MKSLLELSCYEKYCDVCPTLVLQQLSHRTKSNLISRAKQRHYHVLSSFEMYKHSSSTVPIKAPIFADTSLFA